MSGIDAEFAPLVRTQHYAAGPRIDGVEFHDLKRHADDGGAFLEIARLAAGRLAAPQGFEVRQVSYSVLEPGTIKAFHLHLRQSEIWFVPPESRLLVGLLDVRRDSPTARQSTRFILGDGQARLLLIPAGVAHGAANLSSETACIVYFADQQFSPDPERCDEQRLPWDILGADFWARARG